MLTLVMQERPGNKWRTRRGRKDPWGRGTYGYPLFPGEIQGRKNPEPDDNVEVEEARRAGFLPSALLDLQE